jgi:hypothetical protein
MTCLQQSPSIQSSIQRAAAGLERAYNVPGITADRQCLADANVLKPEPNPRDHRLVRAECTNGLASRGRRVHPRLWLRAANRDIHLSAAHFGPSHMMTLSNTASFRSFSTPTSGNS